MGWGVVMLITSFVNYHWKWWIEEVFSYFVTGFCAKISGHRRLLCCKADMRNNLVCNLLLFFNIKTADIA